MLTENKIENRRESKASDMSQQCSSKHYEKGDSTENKAGEDPDEANKTNKEISSSKSGRTSNS